MRKKESIVAIENISHVIYLIRGQRVILDADLATLYGVQTKRLNEQVKRNIKRFPSEFMFRLTEREKAELVANCDHLEKLKFSSQKPYAFTEHGALMAANVLKSEKAIVTSIEIVKAFVHLRKFIKSHHDLIQEINSLKAFVLKNVQGTNQEFRRVWATIEKLMTPDEPRDGRKIGFDLTKAWPPKSNQ